MASQDSLSSYLSEGVTEAASSATAAATNATRALRYLDSNVVLRVPPLLLPRAGRVCASLMEAGYSAKQASNAITALYITRETLPVARSPPPIPYLSPPPPLPCRQPVTHPPKPAIQGLLSQACDLKPVISSLRSQACDPKPGVKPTPLTWICRLHRPVTYFPSLHRLWGVFDTFRDGFLSVTDFDRAMLLLSDEISAADLPDLRQQLGFIGATRSSK